MVIVHHHLMVCALAGRHLHRHMGKVVLHTNQTICVALTPPLRMIWMITV
jgi:hypothetical protein